MLSASLTSLRASSPSLSPGGRCARLAPVHRWIGSLSRSAATAWWSDGVPSWNDDGAEPDLGITGLPMINSVMHGPECSLCRKDGAVHTRSSDLRQLRVSSNARTVCSMSSSEWATDT